MQGWRDFWNGEHAIYVNARHRALHDRIVARDIIGLVKELTPRPREAVVLDHGCGEATAATEVAGACGRLLLSDAAPSVRERLRGRFGREPRIAILAPEEIEALPDASLDLVVANSLAQYLSRAELEGLLGLWRDKLRPGGALVLADVIPRGASPLDDVAALLRFASRGGFLIAALAGLARTFFSDYRRLRDEIGLSRYDEAEMLGLLDNSGFAPERRAANLGHNPKRMTFLARPSRHVAVADRDEA